MSADRTTYQEYNNRNIFRMTTKDRMLLMSIDAFDFYDKDGPAPRMKIRCCNYDVQKPPGARITDEVASFIPLGKFLVLTHDIEAGVLARRQKDAKQHNRLNESYFNHYGGVFSGNSQQPTVSRRLSIVDGLGSASFAFVASESVGEIDGRTGLITPKKGEKPLRSIFINMPDDQLKELSIIGRIYAEQFIGLLLQEQLGMVRKHRQEYKDSKAAEQGGL